MLRTSFFLALVLLATLLGACEGSSGTGGLSIPAAPQYNNPAGPGGSSASTSRQQVLEGSVTLSPDRSEIPLPALGGFGIALELATPSPVPVATPSTAASPPRATAVRPAATASPVPSATVSSVPSAPASLAARASPLASASASPGAEKISTKTTIYPDDAPAAPTPKPSGDVQTFVKRSPIVRGYVESSGDLAFYGLGAIRVTIPQLEQTSGRGFTIAVFGAEKKHQELVAFDASPSLTDGVVASSLGNDPFTLKKATPYLIVLYGDPLPATPAPAGNYPTPGNNPFPTQTPGAPGAQVTQPGMPPQPGYPQQVPTPTPFP